MFKVLEMSETSEIRIRIKSYIIETITVVFGSVSNTKTITITRQSQGLISQDVNLNVLPFAYTMVVHDKAKAISSIKFFINSSIGLNFDKYRYLRNEFEYYVSIKYDNNKIYISQEADIYIRPLEGTLYSLRLLLDDIDILNAILTRHLNSDPIISLSTMSDMSANGTKEIFKEMKYFKKTMENKYMKIWGEQLINVKRFRKYIMDEVSGICDDLLNIMLN